MMLPMLTGIFKCAFNSDYSSSYWYYIVLCSLYSLYYK